MKSFRVEKYSTAYKNQWDDFIRNSKNGTFLFHRNFMDYHADRFEDYSLMVFEKKKLVALLPANLAENKLFSHQGLTYGGLILPKNLKFEKTIKAFKAVLVHLENVPIPQLALKLVPKIYHRYPADEIDYLLFLLKAHLIKTDLSSTILQSDSLKIQSNRIEGVKKARKHNLQIEKTNQFDRFWNEILIPNLQEQFKTQPVHNLSEIQDLANKFPKNIHQYQVVKGDKIVGGCTIFETATTAHVQYISADNNRQQFGTLDFLFQYLIEEEFADKTYFDFGISNENKGLNLNKGLLYWKECFGARGIVYPTYQIETKNHYLLDEVFL
ncbi:MAG TPA: hypothetical protein VK021_11375 [Flavobacteriaceae bacterium]|nr:hypothetical protein [Flavobacteriaceae bacterium]